MSETKSGYGWCQSCGALVFNNSRCHKCGGKVKPFCVDLQLVQQAKRIKELEKTIEQVCVYIRNTGEVNKWKIENWLAQAQKG